MRQQLCEFSEKRFDCIPQTHSLSHSKEQLHRDTCKKTQTPAAAAGDNNCRKWRLLSMNYSKGSYNIKSKLQFNTLCLCIIIDLFCFVLLFPTNTSVCLSVCLLFVSLLFHSYFPSSASLPRIIQSRGCKTTGDCDVGFYFLFPSLRLGLKKKTKKTDKKKTFHISRDTNQHRNLCNGAVSATRGVRRV